MQESGAPLSTSSRAIEALQRNWFVTDSHFDERFNSHFALVPFVFT